MNVKIIRIMARFGTPSPVIGAIIMMISISMTPSWSLNQPLKELGSGGFGSVIFNSGLLIVGSLAMLYAAGLFEFTKGDIVGQIGSTAFLIYAISMCVLGVAVIDLGEFYNQFTTLLFIMIPVSSILLSYSLYKRSLTGYAAIGFIAAVFGVVPWIIGGSIDAFKELVALIPFSIWQVSLGLYMYRLEEPVDFD